MLPLGDTIRSKHMAWCTCVILALNIAVFAAEVGLKSTAPIWIREFGVIPSQWVVQHWTDFFSWPRLFFSLVSSQFLHKSLIHLLINLLYLAIFGSGVESHLGHGRFLMLYGISGVIAALTHIVSLPASQIPLVGASGSIAGVLGAYLLMFPTARVATVLPVKFAWRVVHVPAFVFLGCWFLLQWIRGMTTIGQVTDLGGVAFFAHLGGFIGGMVCAVAFYPKH